MSKAAVTDWWEAPAPTDPVAQYERDRLARVGAYTRFAREAFDALAAPCPELEAEREAVRVANGG